MKKEVIIVSLIIGLSILGYGLINYRLQMKKEQVRQAEFVYYQEMLASCLSRAYDSYLVDWDGVCKLLGLGEKCFLPGYRADELTNQLNLKQANCIKMFAK